MGLTFPHLEYRYLPNYNYGVTVPIATALFSSIATGTLTLTGIVFSLAFVMVQFSSTAYSPRLVFWLSRDPVIWHGLGIFSATFLYSLVALIWVDRWDSGRVPIFSAWVVILLVVSSVVIMSLLVRRLALLQVGGVMRFIGHFGRQEINYCYPQLIKPGTQKIAAGAHSKTTEVNLPVVQSVVHAGEPLAICAYDVQKLVSLAAKADALIVMPHAIGDTLIEGESLLHVCGSGSITETKLRHAVRIGRQRTFEQDPKYAIRLLVDIAIRALSPAVNDPTTAVQCLDHIEDLLRRLSARDLAVGEVADQSGVLRLIFPTPRWEDFLSLAFDEIRSYGASSIQVVRRLRSALYDLASAVPVERQDAIRHYIERLDLTVKNTIKDSEDQTTALQQDRQGLGLSRR